MQSVNAKYADENDDDVFHILYLQFSYRGNAVSLDIFNKTFVQSTPIIPLYQGSLPLASLFLRNAHEVWGYENRRGVDVNGKCYKLTAMPWIRTKLVPTSGWIARV
jgi:hypothetical protein